MNNNEDKSKNENVRTSNLNKINIGNIFWGLLFITIGGLILANNFQLVDVNWLNLWRLWPLMIIAAGLSILSFGHWIWRVLTSLFSLVIIGAILWVALGGSPNTQSLIVSNKSISKTSNIVEQVEVNLKVGASSLVVDTVNQNNLLESTLKSNIASLLDTSNIVGNTQKIDLSMDVKNNNWWNTDLRSSLEVSLTRNLPLQLNIDAGASDINIDMSNAKLNGLSIKAGASNMEMKLGNASSMSLINIDSGVSSILIKVPKDSGVKLDLESGLTSNELGDLRKTGENTYETLDYFKSQNKIYIVSKIGVSSFTIEKY